MNKPTDVTKHVWDESGERCLKCGDKDWMATSECKPTDVVAMLRGHPIYQDNDGVFRFCDNNEPTETTWFNRPCGHCGMSGNSNDGLPDPCLRYLAGVTNACCGHGDPTQAYIVFAGGVVIRGFTVEFDDRREICREESDLILEHNKARRKFYKLPGEGQ